VTTAAFGELNASHAGGAAHGNFKVRPEIPRPVAPAINAEEIPTALRGRKQWVLWRYELRGDKWTKVPLQPSGESAKSDDPATWSSFVDILHGHEGGIGDGIGFMFSEPHAGADLDNCFDANGALRAWAVDTVALAQICGCYIERTPSGVGLHVIGCGKVPFDRGKRKALPDGGVEMYDHARFFTVTGDALDEGTPDASIQPVLDQLAREHFATKERGKETTPPPAGDPVSDPDADALAQGFLSQASENTKLLWAGNWAEARQKDHKTRETRPFPSASEAWAALLARIALQLGAEATVARVRAVALRSPFGTLQLQRGKWPRLAVRECASAIEFAQRMTNQNQNDETREDDQTVRDGFSSRDLHGGFTPIAYLVKGMLYRGDIAVVFGESGAFKSFVMLDLAMYLGLGNAWCGRKVGKQIGVLVVAGEGGTGYRKRMRAWLKKHQIGPEDAQPLVYIYPKAVSLTNKCGIKEALTEAERELEVRVELVVVDTLAANFGPGDESKNEDMSAALAGLRGALSERAAIVVHHVGHGAKDRERGAYSLRATVDWRYLLERSGNDDVTVLRCEKAKDDRVPGPIAFRGEEVDTGWVDIDGDPITSMVFVKLDEIPRTDGPRFIPAEAFDLLLALQKMQAERGNLSVKRADWLKHSGKPSTTFNRYVKALVNAGKVRKMDFGGYRIPDAIDG
jgi:hypothetical protein